MPTYLFSAINKGNQTYGEYVADNRNIAQKELEKIYSNVVIFDGNISKNKKIKRF